MPGGPADGDATGGSAIARFGLAVVPAARRYNRPANANPCRIGACAVPEPRSTRLAKPECPRMTALPVRVRTAAITNLGCRVNQSEMEAVARILRERGIRLVDPHAPADLHVVNTCTVTSIADQKSRQAVRRARRANPAGTIVVTGCSVEIDREAFMIVDPDARLVGNAGKEGLLAELNALVDPALGAGRLDRAMPTLSGVDAVPTAPPSSGSSTWTGVAASPDVVVSSAGIDGIADGRTIGDRTRAFIKVQDGCSFHCTYCIIPRARGPERSLPPDAILAEVRRATLAGRREIVLTGINIGTYDGGWSAPGKRGSHARSALTLAGLVRRILSETDVERIRLSSIEPQHVDDALLGAWADGAPRTMPHLHVPLQSGDDGVLRRMGRRYESATYARIIERARAAIPGLAVHADVIVGFPTEDEESWRRSLAFIRELDPAGLHVFRYSAREGTPALRMAGQVDEATKKARAAELLELARIARMRFARRQLGRELAVLFETRLPDGRWVGHAPNNALVAAPAPGGRSLENAVGRVRALRVDVDDPDRVHADRVEVDWPRRRPLAVLAPSPGYRAAGATAMPPPPGPIARSPGDACAG